MDDKGMPTCARSWKRLRRGGAELLKTASPPEKKASILIIDDDEHILNLLTELLSEKGYVTDTAKSGAEAIDRSKAKSFDLAIIDIVLPDMQGTKLLVRLKDTVPKMRKIVLTGHASLDNAVEAVNLGADAYVMKPIKPQELLKAIEEQLQKQLEETVMTSKKIAAYIEARKADFVEVMRQSLTTFLGESATSAIIYHLGEEAIRDPNTFAEGLKAIFEEKGAKVILEYILKYLEAEKS